MRINIVKYVLIGIVCLIAQTIQSQNPYTIGDKSIYEIRTQQFPIWRLPSVSMFSLIKEEEMPLLLVSEQNWSAHYLAHLGYFCKIELQLEQKANMPVKFRLGTVEYVDRLEGKRENY